MLDLSCGALLGLAVLGAVVGEAQQPSRQEAWTECSDRLTITTWNIRGYPEKDPCNTAWVHCQLDCMGAEVLCMQEISSLARVRVFLNNDPRFERAAFTDSRDSMDNAVFTTGGVVLRDLADPTGFQHPAQAAFVAKGGFDAALVTVHLSWTNVNLRSKEKRLLNGIVESMTQHDPDVMLIGDFNLKEREIAELARSLGMIVMLPAGQEGVGTTQAGNRYDHVLITRDLAEEAMGCRILTFTGQDRTISKKVSDHLPVQAWFRTDECFRDREREGACDAESEADERRPDRRLATRPGGPETPGKAGDVSRKPETAEDHDSGRRR